jgi:quercetin dioxygenase-like cupin family protein
MESAHVALQELMTGGERWREFLRVPALSAGVYVLEAGADDPQGPHGEDEVYVVLQGRARLQVGEATHRAQTGDLLYVAAGAPHKFVAIEERLVVLVIFAPAETGEGGDA